MTANEKRQAVANKYKTIIGRNIYNQDLRDYCFTPYKDGKYYSDCSSSICYSYKEAGYGFGILNTAGIYESSKLTTVENLGLTNGIPRDISLLRVGDMLEFAGNDASRPRCIGHVEMVYSINSDGTVTLCGHGSNTPSFKDMAEYCTYRYNSYATGGWRKGLVCVRRYIQDDAQEDIKNGWIQEGNNWKYYDNNVAVSSKWIQSADKKDWYYIDDNSIMAVNKWIESQDKKDWYYVGSDGKMLKSCTQNINGYEQDFDSDGKWIKHEGWYNNRYYTGNNNLYIKDSWYQVGDDWYYFVGDGTKATNTWAQDKDKKNWYYLGSDGKMQKGGTVKWKGKTYHLNSDGSCKED